MDTVFRIAVVVVIAVVFLSPLVLAALAFRQGKRTGMGSVWVRIVLPMAVVLDWGLLIALGAVNNTIMADVFLVLTLLLLIGSVCISVSKWKLTVATLVLLSFWFWAEQTVSFRDESMLSVSISMIRDRIGFPQGDRGIEVLHKMAVYAKRGHIDAAIHAGKAWVEANPRDTSNEEIFTYVGWLYLVKAQNSPGHADEFTRQAMRYRDKAYETEDEWRRYNVSAYQSLAVLAESAGDLSPRERCVQYGNAIKLLNLRIQTLKYKQQEISGTVVPVQTDLTVEQVDGLSDEAKVAIARVQEKQQKYGCK